MTSINFGVVAAPCCGARYLEPQFASINIEGWKEWSDGYGAKGPAATGNRGLSSLYSSGPPCPVQSVAHAVAKSWLRDEGS